MNAVAFFILAILIVVTAAAAVVLPSLRDAGGAFLAFALVSAVLFATTGAYLVALAQIIVPVAAAAASYVVLRRATYRGLARTAPLVPRLWWLGLGVSLAFAALLITVLSLSGGGWFQGSGQASLVTVLHYAEPYALVIAAVLAVAGVAIAVLLGRTGDDERQTDAMLAARRRRDERVRLRREARETARRSRREAPAAGGGG
ncbi:MAG: hypothetical protein ABR498_06115 [Candidatus Dormibacteria bacterium]